MDKKRSRSGLGTLVVIGGHEDRRDGMRILREVARRAGRGAVVVATVASRSAPLELWREYAAAFRKIGVKTVRHLDIGERPGSASKRYLKVLEGAGAVFFTGGDQLRITSLLGGTELLERIREIYLQGGVIAGTSAGASAVSQTMILSGTSAETHRVDTRLGMAPGLGFLNAIVDQHFAERGRIGRLLGAIALNPSALGIGIDEDTAFIIESSGKCEVLGSGAVYVADASQASDSNVSDGTQAGALSLFNVRLHLLSDGDSFDLHQREPKKNSSAAA